MNDTNERPAEFDRRLIEAMPMMRRLTKKLDPKNGEDLLQETLVAAVANWDNFRDPVTWYGFKAWLGWKLRAVIRNRKAKVRTLKRQTPSYFETSTPASQEEAVNARRIIEQLATSRDGQILIGLAVGESREALGEKFGISSTRLYQLSYRARNRLNKKVA